tara:strand:- start:175 stop:393 length:219 start_codon:yes stop_codon:yes gene_type:complete
MVIKANTIPIINNTFLILFILNYLMTGYIFNAYFLEFYSFLKVFIFFTFNGILTESAKGNANKGVNPSYREI